LAETSSEDISEMVLSLILSGNDTPSGIKKSLEEGGVEMRKAALDKVLKGLVSDGKIRSKKGGRGQRFVPADAKDEEE
jgi:DNA-binding PadR family transcriptional regulator